MRLEVHSAKSIFITLKLISGEIFISAKLTYPYINKLTKYSKLYGYMTEIYVKLLTPTHTSI